MHHHSITNGVNPTKHKLRKIHPQVSLFVKDELQKILSAKFSRAIDYSKWISNRVSISQHDKSIHVYTYFRYLNKECPKDDFPLPNINTILEMIVGYEMYTLIDSFSRYNQIMVAPKD